MRFAYIDALGYAVDANDPVAAGVNYYLAHADDNATEDADKMASLIDSLSFCTNEAVLAWFVENGVKL